MDNKSTTKRMIGAVVLVLIAALLLAWLLKGKNPKLQQNQTVASQQQDAQPISGFPGVANPSATTADAGAAGSGAMLPPPSSPPALVANAENAGAQGVADPNAQAAANTAAAADPAASGQAAASTEAAGAAGAQNVASAENADAAAAQAVAPDNTTSFDIRPGEVRSSVDKNGNVVENTGSLGAEGATQAANVNGAEATPAQDGAAQQAAAGAAGKGAETPVATAESSGAATPKPLAAGTEAAATAKPAAGAATAATETKVPEGKGGAKAGTVADAGKAGAASPEKGAKPAEKGNTADKGTVVAKGSASAGTGKEAAAAKANAPQATAKVQPAAQPRLVNEQRVPELAAADKPAKAASSSAKTNSSNVKATANVAAAKPTTTASSSQSGVKVSTSAGKVPTVAALTAGAASKDGYVIQVLATGDKGKADTVRQTIATDGYPAFIAQANVNGKQVYRVRVGTYKAKGDAVSVQSRLKVRYGQNQFVQNSFVTNNN